MNATDDVSDWILIPQSKLNTSSGSLSNLVPAWYKAFYITLCVSLSIVTVIANIGVLFTVLRHRYLRTPTNSLLLSVVTADLVGGGIMLPIYIQMYVDLNPNKTTCLLRKFLFLLTSSCSLTSLCMVSIDRMLAISYPFFYVRNVTANVAKVVIVSVWILCPLLCSFTFYHWEEWNTILSSCAAGIPRPLYLIVTPATLYFNGFVILLAYIKIYLVARKHRVQIQASNKPSVAAISDVCQSEENTSEKKRRTTSTTLKIKIARSFGRDLKAAKTVSILVGVFLMCWCPVAFFYIFLNTNGIHITSSMKYMYLHDWFMFLSFLNSCLDPILYSLLNRDIRTKIKKMVQYFSCCNS